MSIGFRLLLALPHLIVVYFALLVGAVVVLLGWFAALALGRLPEGFATLLEALLRYITRVYAYNWLLTDEYPPFAVNADYPVQPEFFAGPLNRLAVLFRLILVIPAAIVESLVVLGWSAASLVIWIVALVAGRLPDSLHAATAAVLRYVSRYTAYTWLISSAYPAGLFGERQDGAAPSLLAEDASPSAAAPGPDLPPPPETVAEARPSLVLSVAAKRLVVLFIVLGVLAYGGGGAGGIVAAASRAKSVSVLPALTDRHDRLVEQLKQYSRDAQTCRTAPDGLACLERADSRLADNFETFASNVDSLDIPQSAHSQEAALEQASTRMAGALRSLAAAPNVAQYQAVAQASDVGALGNRFDAGYKALVDRLAG